MQRLHIFDLFLMRIKCIVKNVIIFDLIFDTNQKKSKSNISCSGGRRAGGDECTLGGGQVHADHMLKYSRYIPSFMKYSLVAK